MLKGGGILQFSKKERKRYPLIFSFPVNWIISYRQMEITRPLLNESDKITTWVLLIHSALQKYLHLFFDLDRTLWDFESNSYEALSDVYQKYALKPYFPDPEDFVRAYHKYNERLWAEYRLGSLSKEVLRSKRFELTLKERELINPELAKQIGEEYLALSVIKTRLFPNTIEILEYLKPNYKLYILTNGFRETQFSKMKNCGLDAYFDHVFTSETIGYNKPDTRIFSWAVNSVNGKKKECMMIGDDYDVDIAGATLYGMDTVYFNPMKLDNSAPSTYEITSLLELKSIL